MSDKESLNENQKENKEEENKDSKILQSEENVNKENPLEDKPENAQIDEQNNENNNNNNKDNIDDKDNIDNNNKENIESNNPLNLEENKDKNNIDNNKEEEKHKLRTKEDYELEINNLKKELEEKNKLLISLQNTENPEYVIPEILGKIEAQRLLEMVNENKIKQQRTKIESIKQMVKSLDEQFKNQLKIKEQKINKKLEPFVKKNKDLLQELNS